MSATATMLTSTTVPGADLADRRGHRMHRSGANGSALAAGVIVRPRAAPGQATAAAEIDAGGKRGAAGTPCTVTVSVSPGCSAATLIDSAIAVPDRLAVAVITMGGGPGGGRA